MDDFVLSISAAGERLAALKPMPIETARRAIIGALATGHVMALARCYHRTVFIENVIFETEVMNDFVPLEFWQRGHASDHRFGSCLPAGSAGDYSVGRFRTIWMHTAASVARTYPNWNDLAAWGDTPCELVWEAFGVTMSESQLHQLAQSSGPALSRSWSNVLERQPLRPTRAKSSDVVAMQAAFAVHLMSENQRETFTDPSQVASMLRRIQGGANSVDERAIQSFANAISSEITTHYEGPPPIS